MSAALAFSAAPFFDQITGAKPRAPVGEWRGAVRIPTFLHGEMRFQVLYKTAGRLGLSYFAFCQCAKWVNVVIRGLGVAR